MQRDSVVHVIFTVFLLAIPACATLSGSHDSSFVCSYDTVWDAAVDTMKGFSITSQNKDSGTIETAWLEMEGENRSYGLFAREGFGNRERARLTISVKKTDAVSSVSVLETRQRWHARGGATSQATKWWPIDPSDEAMDEVMGKINVRLKEKGCEAAR
jgi:uncharacterized lipoprotein